LTWYRRSS